MPVLAAPTARPAAGTPSTPDTAPPPSKGIIPFTRASQKKSALIGQYGPYAISAAQFNVPAIQVRPAGFLARVRIKVVCTTAGNAAAVAFQNDAPWNILQNIGFLSPGGDTIISNIDGFMLAMLLKYGAFASGVRDPLADPTFARITGAGATGGSFTFMVDIPVEIDSRDAFCTLQNMNASQQFVLQLFLNTTAQLYTTPPTTPGSVVLTLAMEYYSAPDPANGSGGIPQAEFPPGEGSISLLQVQTPPIVPNTNQRSQLVNVGNVNRFHLLILRDGTQTRTEAAWPQTWNYYVNNDLIFYKDKDLWRSQMAIEYNLRGGVTAVPTLNALDNGVYVLTDFMNSGESGGMEVNGAANRNNFLVTGTGTNVEIEAIPWGAAAVSLAVVTNALKPASAQALYAPQLV